MKICIQYIHWNTLIIPFLAPGMYHRGPFRNALNFVSCTVAKHWPHRPKESLTAPKRPRIKASCDVHGVSALKGQFHELEWWDMESNGVFFQCLEPDSSCVSVDNFWYLLQVVSLGSYMKSSRDVWNCSPQLWQTMRGLYSSHDLTVLPTVLKKQPAAVPTVLTVPFPTRKTWVFTEIRSRVVREHSQNPKKSFPKHARRPHAGNWSKVSWKVQDSTWFNYAVYAVTGSSLFWLLSSLLLSACFDATLDAARGHKWECT